MKKHLSIVLIFLMLFNLTAFSGIAMAADSKVTVKVNFSPIPFDSEAVLRDGTVMVPVCEFSKIMWYEVDWNLGDNKFRMWRVKSNKDLIWQMDSSVLNVNGEDVAITGAPAVINDVVYIPLRAFCDAADMPIEWNAAENAVYFYTDTKEIMENHISENIMVKRILKEY